MARYKHIDTSPRFIAIDLQKQLLPGTFEHALNHLIDHVLDLSRFDTRYNNDLTGASAYPPSMLLKIVLFAYSQGIVRSRDIERACRDHVTFIALSGDTQPHFTTLAAFVSSLGNDIAPLFTQILYICDKQGLIGREMFAIDGVKLPGNASKGKSGTRAVFQHQANKLEAAARTMLNATARQTRKPSSQTCGPKSNNASPACRPRSNNYTAGWRTTPKTKWAAQANPAKATAPTTTPPKWPPAKA